MLPNASPHCPSVVENICISPRNPRSENLCCFIRHMCRICAGCFCDFTRKTPNVPLCRIFGKPGRERVPSVPSQCPPCAPVVNPHGRPNDLQPPPNDRPNDLRRAFHSIKSALLTT